MKKPLDCGYNQTEMNKIFEKHEMDVPYFYVTAIKTVTLSLFFMPVLPLCLITGIIALIFQFCVEKYSLFNKYSFPKPLSSLINHDVYRYLDFVIVTFSISQISFDLILRDYISKYSTSLFIISMANYLFGFHFFFSCLFKLKIDHSKKKNYKESRSYFLSEYDRSNPLTSAQASLDYLRFLKSQGNELTSSGLKSSIFKIFENTSGFYKTNFDVENLLEGYFKEKGDVGNLLQMFGKYGYLNFQDRNFYILMNKVLNSINIGNYGSGTMKIKEKLRILESFLTGIRRNNNTNMSFIDKSSTNLMIDDEEQENKIPSHLIKKMKASYISHNPIRNQKFSKISQSSLLNSSMKSALYSKNEIPLKNPLDILPSPMLNNFNKKASSNKKEEKKILKKVFSRVSLIERTPKKKFEKEKIIFQLKNEVSDFDVENENKNYNGEFYGALRSVNNNNKRKFNGVDLIKRVNLY